MRARGAQVTDIAILVVAADDGIMPQTVEAINHAKAAGVSIIVAINKMDKPGANPDRVKQQLTEYELVPEEWGGDTICVPVSAHTGQGIDELLETVLLVADMKELKANPDRAAKGTVIEARLDKGRGPVATVLVQNGTLHAGRHHRGRHRRGPCARHDWTTRAEQVEEAGPIACRWRSPAWTRCPWPATSSTPCPTSGWPVSWWSSGINAAQGGAVQRPVPEGHPGQSVRARCKQGDMKELNIIVKADVQGSVEAVRQSLEKLSNDEVRVQVIHGARGRHQRKRRHAGQRLQRHYRGLQRAARPRGRGERQAQTAWTCGCTALSTTASRRSNSAMKGMLAPKFREVAAGPAPRCRQVYKISNVGTVAGCYVHQTARSPATPRYAWCGTASSSPTTR